MCLCLRLCLCLRRTCRPALINANSSLRSLICFSDQITENIERAANERITRGMFVGFANSSPGFLLRLLLWNHYLLLIEYRHALSRGTIHLFGRNSVCRRYFGMKCKDGANRLIYFGVLCWLEVRVVSLRHDEKRKKSMTTFSSSSCCCCYYYYSTALTTTAATTTTTIAAAGRYYYYCCCCCCWYYYYYYYYCCWWYYYCYCYCCYYYYFVPSYS